MIRTTRTVPTFAGVGALAAPLAAPAFGRDADDRLVIVNGKSGRVNSDDGRDDLFCVSRRHFAGTDYYGRRQYYHAMHCRWASTDLEFVAPLANLCSGRRLVTRREKTR